MAPINKRVLSVLSLVALTQALLTNVVESLGDLNNGDVLALSKVHYETRAMGLELRCETYERKLRELPAGSRQADISAAAIFQQAIETESLRLLPFRNKSPILSALKECVEKLPKYRSAPTGSQAITSNNIQPLSKTNEKRCDVAALAGSDQDYATLWECFLQQLKELAALKQQLSLERPCEHNQAEMGRKDEQIQKLKQKLKILNGVRDASDFQVSTKQASFEEMRELYNQAYERELRTNKRLEEAQSRIAKLEARLACKTSD